MNTQSHWLNGIAAVALSTAFAAAAEETAPLAADPVVTPQQEISAEVSADIHDSLNGMTPEITLPAVDARPPAPVVIGG